MLNVKQYWNNKLKDKKLIFVDPSVYELKNNNEYSNVNFLHRLVEIFEHENDNRFISIDYPPDMNLKYSDLFIEKTRKNNEKYLDCIHYICTPQFRFEDIKSFMNEFEIALSLHDKKIIGLGNLCRIMHPNKFTDDAFKHIIDNLSNRWIHIYGPALKIIRKYVPQLEDVGFTISVDSTKWTRACHNELKLKHGLMCMKQTRDLYFNEYIKKINEFAEVIY